MNLDKLEHDITLCKSPNVDKWLVPIDDLQEMITLIKKQEAELRVARALEKGNPFYDWAILAIGELAVRDSEAAIELSKKLHIAAATPPAAPVDLSGLLRFGERYDLNEAGDRRDVQWFGCDVDGEYVKLDDVRALLAACGKG